jgi:hypothetical protein
MLADVWMTVEDCARWLDTSAEMIRVLGLRGRFAVSVDPRGIITHVAMPQPEPPEPEEDGPEAELREEDGRLSLAPDAGGELSLEDEG